MAGTAPNIKRKLDISECLRQGREAVMDETAIDIPNNKDVIWWLLKDAINTIEHLPDNESRWLSDANMSNMLEVARRLSDIYEMEVERLRDGIDQYDKMRVRFAGSQNSIDRAEIVLPWMRWHRSRKTKRDVNIIHLMAKNVPPTKIAGKFGFRSRQAVYHIRDHVVRNIHDALISKSLI